MLVCQMMCFHLALGAYQQYTSIVSHVQITQQQSPYLVCMLP